MCENTGRSPEKIIRDEINYINLMKGPCKENSLMYGYFQGRVDGIKYTCHELGIDLDD